MKVHYLEIVTPEADAICAQIAAAHGVTFSEPDASLGGAKTAALSDGSLVGVRGPMHEMEHATTRPYLLVDDIKASFDAAIAAGAEAMVPPMEIPGHGHCAIVSQGGVESAFWQL